MSSATIRLKISTRTSAATMPNAIPPATLTTKSPVASSRSKLPPTATTAVRYATSAVPSLTRLSPSITDVTFRGTPRRRAIVVAASGSVGETMAPSANAAAHGRPGIAACAMTATATVVMSTSAIALSVIARMYLRRSRSDEKYAALKSSGGRKMKRTSSGSSSTSGTPGAKPTRLPPTTSRIGYGTLTTRASVVSAATVTSRKRTISSACSIAPRSYLPDAPGGEASGVLREARSGRRRPRARAPGSRALRPPRRREWRARAGRRASPRAARAWAA